MTDSVQQVTTGVDAAMLARLADPFAPNDLEWRVGSTNGRENDPMGIALTYITARAVMQRLDEALGPHNWQDTYQAGPDGGVMCGISVRMPDGSWVTKWDGASNTDVEAVKGGLSDAFKRAAVKWGIGRYLYEFPTVWCKIEKRGRSWVLVERPAIPVWAYPAGYTGDKDQGARVALDKTPGAAPTTTPPPAKKEAPAVTPKAETAAPKVETKEEPAGVSEALARASSYKIPSGLPLGGSTLGTAVTDPKLGRDMVSYLAGRKANRQGKMYAPKDDTEQRLQKAAQYLLDNLN